MSRTLLPFLAFAAGCGSELQLVQQTGLDVFTQVPNEKVDIVFVVDDSNSMEEEQEALAAGFESFARTLQDAGRNWQLGVVSTTLEERGARLRGPVLRPSQTLLRDFRDQVMVGIEGSTQEQGLAAAASAVSDALLDGPNRGLVRDDAMLLVIVVTDEEDCSDGGALAGTDVGETCYSNKEALLPVPELVADLADAKDGDLGQVMVSGIIGRNHALCETAYDGTRYLQAAQLTGGMTSDICASDWSPLLHQLGLLASGLREEFELSELPAEGSLGVRVDGAAVAEGDRDGWTLEGERTLVFHGRAVPDRGAEIVVEYVLAVDGTSTTAP